MHEMDYNNDAGDQYNESTCAMLRILCAEKRMVLYTRNKKRMTEKNAKIT